MREGGVHHQHTKDSRRRRDNAIAPSDNLPIIQPMAKPKDSTTRGWWVGHRCTQCGQPVRTTKKHGHYTITADGTVTVRHTIGVCTPHPNRYSKTVSTAGFLDNESRLPPAQ